MIQFRDFLYLDTARLHSFVAQIRGGLDSEASEKMLQGSGVGAGVSLGGFGKVDASKVKNTELQRSIQMTDPTYFDVLHKYLTENGQITDLTTSDVQGRNQLSAGYFIEIHCSINPPVLENWIKKLETTLSFFERNANTFNPKKAHKGKGRAVPSISQQNLTDIRAMMNTLIDFINLSRDSENPYIRAYAGKQQYAVWCGILSQFEILPLQETLPIEVHILGRVERLLDEQDTWKMVDFSQFVQPEGANQVIEFLSELSNRLGKGTISEEDVQARHPDIFVIPIAIYR
jgi:hypothetical protein